MSKIRINELARQLEVKSGKIIEKLAEFGVPEKLTHSSSIDDDMAERLRHFYSGDGSAAARKKISGTTAAERPDSWYEDDGDSHPPASRAVGVTTQPPDAEALGKVVSAPVSTPGSKAEPAAETKEAEKEKVEDY
jgi:translation initiation factor IF-2